ncbi:MAG: hypothetical protein HFI09_02210 [Bacilli bacterium]|nr:hypothetical protein [Bacilli bacterium]
MLNEILGYIIAPNGDYMSFGKWSPRIGFNSSESYFHETAVILAMIENKWYQKYPELGISDSELNKRILNLEVYEYFSLWSLKGFISVINSSFEDQPGILGYFPSNSPFLQKMTLLLLKEAILYQKNIPSSVLVNEVLQKDLSIYVIYQQLLDELQKEDSYFRKKKI